MNAAVFLDKDGTLIEDIPYNVDPDRLQLCPGVVEGLRSLDAAGFKLIVISNQSGVARGLFPESALVGVERRLCELIQVPLTGFYYCPHHPQGVIPAYSIACACRKPQPGMLLQAAGDHDIDLAKSWFVGDILHDIEAGRRSGCRTVLIDRGNETEWQLSLHRLPHHVVNNFFQAAQVILALTANQPPIPL